MECPHFPASETYNTVLKDFSETENYLEIITVRIASTKNVMLSPMVALKSVFSMPRLAENTPPESAPVKPPNPAPLLCIITLAINAIETKINPMFK